jgi:glycosyltransferase involved in cell wall biosynthesis
MIADPLPIKVSYNSPLTAKRVITIGRYSYEKGYDLLLRVWSIVEKKLSDWQLDIFAMGDPTPYVKMMDDLSIDKKRCHLNSSVVDVEDEYMKSSILVQPSRTEGFGLVIVEAMSCGLPVVSFDCENGPRSIITNGEDGFLIPPFDVEMFANSLMRLMSDDDLRESMGEKGKQNSQRYDIDIVGQQWKRLFDELMQNNGV